MKQKGIFPVSIPNQKQVNHVNENIHTEQKAATFQLVNPYMNFSPQAMKNAQPTAKNQLEKGHSISAVQATTTRLQQPVNNNYNKQLAEQRIQAVAPVRSSAKVDPFSTPARRRRLIGDISSFLLKQYYQKACEHVHQFRIETKAAIRIQCVYRCYSARQKLWSLKIAFMNKNSSLIQMNWRCHAAKNLLKKLRSEFILKCKTILAIKLQCLVRKISAKRELQMRRQVYKEYLLRREISSIRIQTNVRMLLCRLKYKKLLQKLRNEQLYQQLMTIKIQSHCRRLIAERVLFNLRLQRKHENLMANKIAHHWRMYVLRRKILVTKIQKCVRGWKCRIQYKLLKKKKIEQEKMKIERVLMSKADLQSSMCNNINKLEKEAPTITMDIDINLFNKLSEFSFHSLFTWLIAQNLLSYKKEFGFNVGWLLHRVIFAAEQSLHNTQQNVSSDQHQEVEIKIKMEENTCNSDELESDSFNFTSCLHWLPDARTHSIFSSVPQLLITRHQNDSIELFCRADIAYVYRNKLLSTFAETNRKWIKTLQRPLFSILLRKTKSIKVNSSSSEYDPAAAEFIFKNVTVTVTTESLNPIADDEEMQESEVNNHEAPVVALAESIALVEEATPLTPPVEEEKMVQEPININVHRISRPTTASRRMKISIDDELERKRKERDAFIKFRLQEIMVRSAVRKIQKPIRVWYNCRGMLATKLQRVLKTSLLLHKWRKVVAAVMYAMTLVIQFLQKRWRGVLARRNCHDSRNEFCRGISGSVLQQLSENILLNYVVVDILDDKSVLTGDAQEIYRRLGDPTSTINLGNILLSGHDLNVVDYKFQQLLEMVDPPPNCVMANEAILYHPLVKNCMNHEPEEIELGDVEDCSAWISQNDFNLQASPHNKLYIDINNNPNIII